MSDTDIVRVKHPITEGVFDTTRAALEVVWAERGWEETTPDTPLTDALFREGGVNQEALDNLTTAGYTPLPPAQPDQEEE